MWRMGYGGARLNVGQSIRKLLERSRGKTGAGTRMTVTVERSGQTFRKQTNMLGGGGSCLYFAGSRQADHLRSGVQD